jgi:choline kinase
MRGIILAAGRGARLNGVAGDKPKCLVEVGGATLIERQIHALRVHGVYDIVAVVGFGADLVRKTCGPEIEYVENDLYDQTNSLYSLWLTSHLLAEGFVVMNSDVLFHPQLLTDLLTARHEDALLIEYCGRESDKLGEEEMKVKVAGGCVVDISKKMDPREADGENLGIVKFGPSGAALLVEQMDRLIDKQSYREWAPRAFRDFAAKRPLHAIGTRGYPWTEIDFPEDYRRAIDEVLPRIEIDNEEVGSMSLAVALTNVNQLRS